MADITIPVPDERVAEFYQFFGRWLSGESEAPEMIPRFLGGNSEASRARVNWTGVDDEHSDAVVLWEKISTSAKALFGVLIDSPDTRFTGRQIATAVNLASGASGVAGMLSRPGQVCWKLNRHLPTHWKDGQDGAESVYWMDAAVAALFAKVRTELES